ncbi:MAG: NosD domain-containing protein, partial [Nitrospinota bacterium]
MKNLGFLSKVFFSGTLLSLFFSGSGSAATLYVHPEQGVYPQIQLAINAAIIGDEILVAPGVYQPVTFTKQQIHVESEKGPEVTKIIGSGVGAAVYFSQLSTGSSISGFHISGPDNGVKVDCSTPGNICRTLSIKNNIIEGAGLNGISLIAGSSKCGEGSEISHVAIANNTIVGSVRSGIAFDLKGREEEDQCEESSGKIQFVKTENNIIVKNRKYGIHRMDRDESPFTDNTFFNNVFRN